MRVKDFTAKNGFNHNDFVQFMKDNNLQYEGSLTGYTIPDANAAGYRKRYIDYCNKRREQIIAKRQQCLLTTASNLNRYIIKDYYGLVSGHAFFHAGYFGQQATAFIGTAGDSRTADLDHVMTSYTQAENRALKEMKDQALFLGANAVLSIQQSSTIAGGVVCVTVHGTAAVVEKNNGIKAQPENKEELSVSPSDLAKMRPHDKEHHTNPYIDQDLCIGCEMCVGICPELFQMKNNKAIVLSDMTEETRAKGNEAIDNCPVGAILEI